jgi:hypothetical protein
MESSRRRFIKMAGIAAWDSAPLPRCSRLWPPRPDTDRNTRLQLGRARLDGQAVGYGDRYPQAQVPKPI